MTRVLSYTADGVASFGVLDRAGTGIVDLGRRLPEIEDLGELVAAGRLTEARGFETEGADVALADVVVDRPIMRPGKIFCIGVNYGGRAAEYADPTDAAYPSVFPRFADSFTGHEQSVLRPPESPQLDYEGEIVVVIGPPPAGGTGRRIPLDRARDHIAGLSLANEGTIRDWVRHAKFNVTQGKNWHHSGAIGPWIVPIDEFGDLETLRLTTRVNGELRQDDTPATMKYPIDYQIHYLSTFTELRAGDLILSGTPTGAGARFDPPRWLVPGDVIEVSVPEIGTLRSVVADEFEPGSTGATHRAPAPR